MIIIEDLNYSYERNKSVLNNINLTIKTGEFVGLVGPNGCGKSTLINLICRVLDLQSGYIAIDGIELLSIPHNDLAKLVAVVPQESFFEFDFTALEIVLMGRLPYLGRFQLEGKSDRKLAKVAMKQTKCWDFRNKYMKHLSGGEKQRVVVARALVQDTKYLLLDEPTSHLDMNFQFEVLDIMARLNRKKKITIISVFHDINHASKYCSRLLLMKSGEIIDDGVPNEVINYKNMSKLFDFDIILKHHPKEGYKYILPDLNPIGRNNKDQHKKVSIIKR
jgi:iron complex transport system ATP-binding protein